MAKRGAEGPRKCKVCGFDMIPDETIIQGGAGLQIRRTFLHCVNGQCGHIVRTGEFPIEATVGAPIR